MESSSLKTCILCFTTDEETIDLFGDDGKKLKISKILTKHFWFKIHGLKDFPKSICQICWQRTVRFHEFYQSVQAAHETFLARWMKNFDFQLENQVDPFYAYGELTWQDTDSKDETDNKAIIQAQIHEGNDCSTLEDAQAWIKIEAKDEPEVIKLKKEDTKVKTVRVTIEKSSKQILLNQVREIFDMNCDFCGERSLTLPKAREHYRKQHSYPNGYIKCCNRKYRRLCRIKEHVEWHLDPNSFPCEKCGKTFKGKEDLRSHLVSHVDNEDRPFDCQHCSKRFSNQPLLKKHLNGVHTESKNFVCDICDRRYKTYSILRGHILTDHVKAYEQVCDICAKVFKTKQNFKDHMMTHTNESRIQCSHCGTWLKNKLVLRKHIRLHKAKPKTCQICQCVKPNQAALSSHMRAVHGEAKNKCTFCDKAFIKKIALREHVATHTGEYLYVCRYCPQMFKSSGNMHKHRKSAHYEEWCLDKKKTLDAQ